jgi:hypothetical protein
LRNEIVEANGNFPKPSPPAEIVVVGSDRLRRMVMLRKTVIALLAVTSVGMASPTMAFARGGGGGGGHGGGGGFGGGGFGGGGGFHGGGVGGGGFHGAMAGGFRDGGGFHDRGGGFFSGRGFHGRGRDFGRRFGFGFYPYDDYAYDYPYEYGYYPYSYSDAYYDNGSCYVVQRRVHTTHGWRLQPLQVCG